MRKLFVIGIGTGNPDHLTLEGVAALAQLDVVFVLDKGSEKRDLVALRRSLCARHIARPYRTVEAEDPVRDPRITSYRARVDAWHEQRAILYEKLFREHLGEHETGGILAWGDPSLYDSTLRILERVVERGAIALSYEVIPGISSLTMLAARHKIALNRVSGAVHVTTGRRLREEGLPTHLDDVVVMLDGECSFLTIDDRDIDIYWGAYLGTEHELLWKGPLAELKHRIVEARVHARRVHGWIMDIYLLRRRHVA